MSRFITLKKEEIEKAFLGEKRQYFVGDIQREQNLPFLFSQNVEMGLTIYEEYTVETAHRHSVVKEYNYVIDGKTQYLDPDTKEIYEYQAGDFYAVNPGTTYLQKAEAGTKILFVKEPSMNDEEMVDMDEEMTQWTARSQI